ncbi:MAG: DUF3352 domain-containing protein [Leptolyngbya sp. SIOISBB]|nr:DUF3352 domain-containing protein [Leptolyngbya sp. SIOISBB]
MDHLALPLGRQCEAPSTGNTVAGNAFWERTGMKGFLETTWLPIASSITVMLPVIAAAPSVASPHPAELLPPNTAYTIMLDMRSETWDQLNQYALFQQFQAQGMGAPNPGGLPFLPLDLDYEADIAPWVGDDVAIALLPIDVSTGTVELIGTIEDHEILIAPIENSAAFSDRFNGDFVGSIGVFQEGEPEVLNYQGVDIVYWEPVLPEPEPDSWPPAAVPNDGPTKIPARPQPDQPPLPPEASPQEEDGAAPQEWLKALPKQDDDPTWSPATWADDAGLAIAVFPDFIVAAASPTAIQTWMDLRPTNPATALAQNEDFLQTLDHPHADAALGILYGDISELVNYAFVDFALPDLPLDFPNPSDFLTSQEVADLTAMQLAGHVEAIIYPDSRGIRVQGRGYYNDPLMSAIAATIEPAPPEVLSHIPKDSYGMLNGRDIAGFWEEVTTTLEASEETSAWLDQARGFFTAMTGLDLDEDVFGWMDRGFTVFLYPTSDTPLAQFFPEFRVGWGIALQTSDRATAENTFTTLDGLMEEFLIAVEPTTINGQAATSWEDYMWDTEETQSFFGRTWVDEDTLLITTSIDALSTLAQLEPAQALPNALRFVESTRDFPTDNQGYLFANAAPIRALLTGIFPPDPNDVESLEFLKLMASIQALSGTVSFQDEYAQVDGMLLLAPAE